MSNLLNQPLRGIMGGAATSSNSPNFTSPPVLGRSPLFPTDLPGHLDDVAEDLLLHKTFPVDLRSQEFQTIKEMMHPIQVLSVEKVANPDLWQKFANRWQELLKLKSEDLSLLSELGLGAAEVQSRSNCLANNERDPLLRTVSARYSPNQALLFHYPRAQDDTSRKKILREGLDERTIAPTGNSSGRGIYFKDDPIGYVKREGDGGFIFIFAVLLGDCLSVDDDPERDLYVREPAKAQEQKRNPRDTFFESVTARTRDHQNEYVIYNRSQCYPLYQVKYWRSKGVIVDKNKTSIFAPARHDIPTVAWRKNTQGKVPMPNQKVDFNWPFFATSVLAKMSASPNPVPVFQNEAVKVPAKTSESQANSNSATTTTEKLAVLASLDFHDVEHNKKILEQCKGDLDQTFNILYGSGDHEPEPTGAYVPGIYLQPAPEPESQSNLTLDEKLLHLATLGFLDESWNKQVLLMFDNNLERAVNFLLDNGSSPPNPTPLEPPTSGPSVASDSSNLSTPTRSLPVDSEDSASPKKKVKLTTEEDPTDPLDDTSSVLHVKLLESPSSSSELEECFSCSNKYGAFSQSPSFWMELKCADRLCLGCYQEIEVQGITMSGVEHKFIKCPVCRQITGTEVGNCPDGKMTVSISPSTCEGHPGHNSIQIEYLIDLGKDQLKRTAFLPNTQEGNEVLKLLRTAWDRRLCFAKDTMGKDTRNAFVWNIQHKIAVSGGARTQGYPDQHYLERVKRQLKAHGIE